MTKIKPLGDNVLVSLRDVFADITLPSKQFDSKVSGILEAVSEDVPKDNKLWALIGKKVYFERYRDDTAKADAKAKYSIISVKDIKGYETEE